MTMSPVIRIATTADAADLLALQEVCWSPEMHDTEEDILRRLLWDVVLVAIARNRIVGATIVEHRRSTGWHIYAIEVAPEYRRKGIASELLRTVRGMIGTVTAEAVTDAGRSFLEHAGFVSHGVLMQRS